jgi:uncharacterized membrane protein
MPRTRKTTAAPTPSSTAPPEHGVTVEKTVTILRSADELFAAFRDFSVVPRFMSRVQSVKVGEGGRARWIAALDGGDTVEWETEITEERPGERIHWRSIAGSEVQATGSADFRPAPGDRGTEVKVRLTYAPPAGRPGRAALKLLGKEPKQEITRDLYRLRQVMEAGVIATTEGQPSGRRS